MPDLKASFLGIEIRNPLIIASSPLTESMEGILSCEKHGAGAVIAKSCSSTRLNESGFRRCAFDDRGWWAASSFNREIQDVNDTCLYLKRAVRESTIPIFASVSELTLNQDEWLNTCQTIEETGVAGIQLDLFYFENVIKEPDFSMRFANLLQALDKELGIPIFPKLNVNLPTLLMADIFKRAGVEYVSLLDSVSLPAPILLENAGEQRLRFVKNIERASLFGAWQYPLTIKYLYDLQKEGFSICAGGGVQKPNDAIELLMFGARAIQVATAIILEGYSKIEQIIYGIKEYMVENNLKSISDFYGVGSSDNIGAISYISVKAKCNPMKCTGCCKCVSQRFCTAISRNGTGIDIDEEICEGCSLCVDLCPSQSIYLE